MQTMKNGSVVFFLGLCPIIPAIAHFAEGLIFAAEFWLLFGAGIFGRMLIAYLGIERGKQLIEYASITVAAVLYGELVRLMFPMVILNLESYIYIFAFSYMLSAALEHHRQTGNIMEFPVLYSIVLIAASFLRELFAFGTLSIPAHTGLISIPVFPLSAPFRFWGSGAGILILLGIGLWLFRSLREGTPLTFHSADCVQNSERK